MADAIRAVAAAITPPGAGVWKPDEGGAVGSMTEAAIYIGEGLRDVAAAIREFAAVVESRP